MHTVKKNLKAIVFVVVHSGTDQSSPNLGRRSVRDTEAVASFRVVESGQYFVWGRLIHHSEF